MNIENPNLQLYIIRNGSKFLMSLSDNLWILGSVKSPARWRHISLKPSFNILSGTNLEYHVPNWKAGCFNFGDSKWMIHSPVALILFFFLQFYWNVINMQHCIGFKYTEYWFDLHTSWNIYHNKFSEYPSSHVNTTL